MLFYKIVVLILFDFVARSTCDGDIVSELTNRFYDVSSECIDAYNDIQPLYKCSGIIIRGVRYNESKYAWSLKPADKEQNSFAFGFLRRDHPFSRLGKGYDAGFILYPHLSTPQQKNTQKVLCGFPVDAWTDLRYDRGCGLRRNDTTDLSRPCDAQNITSYEQWLIHYNNIMNSESQGVKRTQTSIIALSEEEMVECSKETEFGRTGGHNFVRMTPFNESKCFQVKQCGFDLMTEETAVRNFGVFLKANIHLQTNSNFASINSELRLEGWDENSPKQIPIQTFFYFIDSKEGYANVLKYQEDFYEQTGENLPIVGIRLPSASNPYILIKEGIC